MDLELPHDSPLWRYAVALYGRPGVREWLLGQQDRLGVDVNFVLLACWCGEQGIALDEQVWQTLDAATESLRRVVIAPLRRQRRQLDGLAPAAVRGALLQAELQAENALHAQLWQACYGLGEAGDHHCWAHNLATLARFHGLPGFSDPDRLLRHLPLAESG